MKLARHIHLPQLQAVSSGAGSDVPAKLALAGRIAQGLFVARKE